MNTQAEYIWLDGTKPTHTLRSKTRIVNLAEGKKIEASDFPEWGFDGSSTGQAPGDNSDCVLNPVNVVDDPLRGEGNYLVMCEVFNADGTAHESNTRAKMRQVLDNGGAKHEVYLGFEQEYTFFKKSKPYGWPDDGFPRPQGPFYCGVGADRVFGREIVEEHTQLCIDSDLMIFGTNAEVMPGQWEFQIGYRGFEEDDLDPLNVCDHLWLAEWLLHRVSEEYGVTVSFENKPVKGDWNGAGCHTNFSTKEMRSPETGKDAIESGIKRLSQNHKDHVRLYGYALDERLTGLHETCSISEFRYGVSDRGASIRIPLAVQQKGYGYIEDRRPGANSDPYLVAARLIATVCEVDDTALLELSEKLQSVND